MKHEKESNSHDLRDKYGEPDDVESSPGTKMDVCAVCKRPIHKILVVTYDADIMKWVHYEGMEFDHPAIKK